MPICSTATPAPHPTGRHALLGCGLAATLALSAGGCSMLTSDEGRGKAMTPQARADATPVQSDGFAKLGYRVEWRGFPTMLPGEHVKTLEILGDVIAVQESAGVVSVLEARSGQTRP